jgi:hypothetical protein
MSPRIAICRKATLCNVKERHSTSSDIFKYEKAANHSSVECYERQGASPNCRLRSSLSRHSINMHV